MTTSILYEHIPELAKLLQGVPPVFGGISILDSAYAFSRMLHGPGSNSGDVFYRAFVPELGGPLYPREMELTKRCLKSERGELDRVGATIFPGLVKVSQGIKLNDQAESVQVCHKQHASGYQVDIVYQPVVRRAQVVCECALGGTVMTPF